MLQHPLEAEIENSKLIFGIRTLENPPVRNFRKFEKSKTPQP